MLPLKACMVNCMSEKHSVRQIWAERSEYMLQEHFLRQWATATTMGLPFFPVQYRFAYYANLYLRALS